MNKKTVEFQSLLKNKKVAVLGVGISNKPLIRYIAGFGSIITAFDMAEESDPFIQQTKQEFQNESIELTWSCGKNYLEQLHGFDIIFKTPKIRTDLPELIRERSNGTIITSEMEAFMECCPCKMIAVTGSDGKTTTTTLISLILKEEGYTVHVGGNIGTPLLNQLDLIQETDFVVLELSSFQLQSMRKSPDVAVVTNVSPNHLDVHKDYQEYIDAKKNIFLYQGLLGKVVLNFSNDITNNFAREARGEVVWFQKKDANGYYYDKSSMYFPSHHSIPRDQILLVGTHNVENYCAAIAAVQNDVSFESIQTVVRSFQGVEHRIEFVREIGGVAFYNSSIDSSPTRTKATLKAFQEAGKSVVVIAGGKDKNSDYTGLGEAMLQVSRKIILCGQNSPMIRESIEKAMDERILSKTFNSNDKSSKRHDILLFEVNSYEDAVNKAREVAESGECVVLTPAGTSFDRFRNFEERGNVFKSLIQAL